MNNINYTIRFYSDWHCGSGLAAGADVDALVVKDRDGLPYVPGKTIKGLVREALDTLVQIGAVSCSEESLDVAFGTENAGDNIGTKGTLFFTNATLSEMRRESLIANGLGRFLYRSVASTAINDDGIAKDHSLRKTEVVVPCDVQGIIRDVPEEMEVNLRKALKMIKRLGVGRTRGLGRCDFLFDDEK